MSGDKNIPMYIENKSNIDKQTNVQIDTVDKDVHFHGDVSLFANELPKVKNRMSSDLKSFVNYKPHVDLTDLHFMSEAVPFYGRDHEMQKLMEFCEDATPFLWTNIGGEAGTGKSRMALEFSKRLNGSWEWFFFDIQDNPLSYEINKNLFVVIDYVTGRE